MGTEAFWMPAMMGTMAVGTAMQVQATKQQGADTMKLAEQRAAIDMANADAAENSSVEEAKIKADQGRRLIETQKSNFAAANVRINVGDPLVIEKETQENIASDVGYILEGGRTQADAYRSSAALEIATGKAAKKNSKSTALIQGLSGFGTIGMMGYKSGWGSKTQGSTVPMDNQGLPQYKA